ncbi:glycoprotein 3-alpha-L-fucosyltransferase A-like [Paramacrobiotus metropolitanus]|uniref:glycoprotein 3-alpha-L-fucosyltransferase A-like n=1 Tax=Paramacrobiotus metropolitanus TaxID=2943436 RepID=UPI00244640B9|nr:glycoprotein 3-alpha-L-fucosyltransferase A-like [Paramacrobiotus metropolitanus]
MRNVATTINYTLKILWRKLAVNRAGRIISLYALLFLIFFNGKLRNLAPNNEPEAPPSPPEAETPPIPKFSVVNENVIPVREKFPDIPYERWYMSNATLRTSSFTLSLGEGKKEIAKIWPENHGVNDRVENQLLYSKYSDDMLSGHYRFHSTKTILFAGQKVKSSKRLPVGKAYFYKTGCPVKNCRLTYDLDKAKEADAIVFKDYVNGEFIEGYKRPLNQIWMLSLLEPPNYSKDFNPYKDRINWTATYRHDSELVTPYEKFVLYDRNIKSKNQTENIAAKKRGFKHQPGRIAWFVSNCEAPNNRLAYAKELAKYYPVDIFGRCGPHKCDLSRQEKCLSILQKDYKYYLAFENSNCRWYITEKFWIALRAEVVPIVMGAPVSDYEAVAPYGSFIHVDNYAHPKQLAEYLHYLDAHDAEYNEYFRWTGTGELINTYSYCRLCTLMHSEYPRMSYGDVQTWWQMGGTACSNDKNNFTLARVGP